MMPCAGASFLQLGFPSLEWESFSTRDACAGALCLQPKGVKQGWYGGILLVMPCAGASFLQQLVPERDAGCGDHLVMPVQGLGSCNYPSLTSRRAKVRLVMPVQGPRACNERL